MIKCLPLKFIVQMHFDFRRAQRRNVGKKE